MARTAGSALLALSMALAATSGLAEKGGKGGGGGKPGGGGGDPEPAPDAAIVCMGRGMWKVNADGSNLTRILSRVPGWDPEPAWSHDAGHVVVNAAFGEVGIYRLEANGSNVTMIAGLTSGYVAGPDWSPVPTLDGSYRVVFEDDGLNGPPGSGNRDLFLVRPDGTALVNLTQTPDSSEHQAAWAPDATRIACKANGGDFVVIHLGYDSEAGTLVEVPPRTSLVKDVPDSPLRAMAMKGDPTWSPDGTAVAVWARPTTVYADPTDIWIIPVNDPAGAFNLTNTPGIHEGNPAWSADGSEVAFRSQFSDGKDDGVYAVSLDGSGYRRIVDRKSKPNWRPFP
jgi:Tol biopolymer transport system component